MSFRTGAKAPVRNLLFVEGTADGWPRVSKLWVPRPCVFCKGGYETVATMRFSAEIKTGAVSRIVPTLRKEREEWGTHFISCVGEWKGWATRPFRFLFRECLEFFFRQACLWIADKFEWEEEREEAGSSPALRAGSE
jgi:hypothetical protein